LALSKAVILPSSPITANQLSQVILDLAAPNLKFDAIAQFFFANRPPAKAGRLRH
jgi:hypothetical protein